MDGSAITEENVMRLMEAKVAEWGGKIWGSANKVNDAYPAGNTSDVRTTVWQYVADGSASARVSCTSGCGGWATYLSDAAFGTTGFPLRKTTFANMRAGDIIIYLNDGKISHIAIASGKTTVDDIVTYTITYQGAYTANPGTVPGHTARELHANNSRVLNYDSTSGNSVVIYTRYPN